jgi:hypothetical protein
MIRAIVLSFFAAALMAGVVSAQPDRSAALEKAKAKFVKDMAKADESMLATIDKAIAQATKSGNKMLQEKLNYERPLFVSQHLVPTAFPTDYYLKERARATKELMTAYQPAINDLTKAKKFEEVTAVEDSLNDMLKAARGYGLAIPDIDFHPDLMFQIENKGLGLVIDTELENGRGKLVLSPKTAKSKQSQFWKLEREDKGFLIRNVKSKHYLNSPGATVSGDNTPMASIGILDRKNETPASFLFQLTSVRHEFFIESIAIESVLMPFEKKVKGVTNTYLTLDKKESTKETPASPAQLWKLIEVK